MAELDSVAKVIMSPYIRMQKILKRAKELNLTVEDIEKMTEEEIQDKFREDTGIAPGKEIVNMCSPKG